MAKDCFFFVREFVGDFKCTHFHAGLLCGRLAANYHTLLMKENQDSSLSSFFFLTLQPASCPAPHPSGGLIHLIMMSYTEPSMAVGKKSAAHFC